MNVSLGFWQISTLFFFALSLTLIETMGGASVKVESGLQGCLLMSQKITVGQLLHHFCCFREKKNRKCKWFCKQLAASCMKERVWHPFERSVARELSELSGIWKWSEFRNGFGYLKKVCLWVSGFNDVYLVLRREILVIAEYKAEYTAECQLFYPVAGVSGGSQSGKGSPRRRSSVSQSSLPAWNPFPPIIWPSVILGKRPAALLRG